MEKRDFFISYTKADKAEAEWIANVLKEHGYSVYIQMMDIGPGQDFLEEIEMFMDNSRSFIAVWSKNYARSKWARHEFRNAYAAWKKKEWDEFIPVKIQNCHLPKAYASLVYVDLFNVDEKEEHLLNEIKHRPSNPLRNLLKMIKFIMLFLLIAYIVYRYLN